VTKLVLTVVSVYIICWLPHWVTQILVILEPPDSPQSPALVTSILLANCLQYSNSAMNPLLYAGLSDNFRKSFRRACPCGLPSPWSQRAAARTCSFTTRRTVRGPRFTAVLQEESSSSRGRPDPSTGLTGASSLGDIRSLGAGQPEAKVVTTAVVNGLLAPPTCL